MTRKKHYNADSVALRVGKSPGPAARREEMLKDLGAAVRARRSERGLTMRALADRAHVSERFMAQLETGTGNISVARLQDVAEALGTTAADLLKPHPTPKTLGILALVGLRGAGKSSIGAEVARRLGVPFVELDALIAREAGMSVALIFEVHGEAYFRRIEREALRNFLDRSGPAVLATGGSLVADEEAFALLRARATTVWLKARAKDHWDRVVAQGDGRPMRDRPRAMSELEALLSARKALYSQAAHVVDTSRVSFEDCVRRVLSLSTPEKRGDS